MRRTLARLSAAALAAGAALLPLAPPASSLPIPSRPAEGFYSVPYSTTLYWVHWVGSSTYWQAATLQDWASRGYPAPQPVPVRYVKAPWSPTIIADPVLPGAPPGGFGNASILTSEQWARAGYPTPEVTTKLGPFLQYRKYYSAPTIWALIGLGTDRHALTYPEWVAAGQPQPTLSGYAPDSDVRGWSTSSELFAVANDGSWTHKLTYAEWAGSGYPSFTRYVGGFYKLSWDDHIAFVDPSGDAHVLTPADWAAYAFPTPAVSSMVPGDDYCYDDDQGAVYYAGATLEGYLTDAEVTTNLGVQVADVPSCYQVD